MRTNYSRLVLSITALLLLLCPPATLLAQEDDAKTHEVKAEKFEVQLELSGVFAAEEAAEISLEPKSWSQFKVVEAVPHGATVSEGQVLIRFDDEEINDAIEDLQADQQLAELSIMQSEEELPRLEKALDLQHETAERAHRIAREDLERWNEIDRPLTIKSSEFSLKNSKQNLEYQQEELEQLLQMYEADDLTEETEEIILKRQRNAVESAEFYYSLAKVRQEEVLDVQIPRADAAMKTALEQAELALAEAKTAMAFSTNEKQFSLEKAKHTRKRAIERHAELLADRELMTVKAPQDGVVYYGRAVDGKWTGTQSMIESLRAGGNASPRSVLMTIVQVRPLKVLSTVAEKNVVDMKPGAAATIVPTANEDAKIEAKIAGKSAVPVGQGDFSLEVEVTGEAPEWLVPGMTGKVKVTTYEKENALTVPDSAVRTDEEDEEKKYVLVQVEGQDEPERRDVKVGKTHKGKTEILEGVKAGDKVVLGEPETDEKPAAEEEKEEETKTDEEDPAEEETDAEEATDSDSSEKSPEKPDDESADDSKEEVESDEQSDDGSETDQ
jgi:HlyD family secretion protein